MLEQSIIEGNNQVKELFEFVSKMAVEYEAGEMEKAIFSRAMQIGLFALKGYFAVKGSGDIGSEISLLLLRYVYTSNDWDAYRAYHMEIERDRLYHKILPFLTIEDGYSSTDDVEEYKAA